MNEWRKYRLKGLSAVLFGIIDLVCLGLYILCLEMQNDPSCNTVVLNVISNILLVAVSILTTSLLSIPLIEVREKNKMCEEMLLSDVLTTPKVFDSLSQEQKESILHSIECNVFFDNCDQKEEMFDSIRRKIEGDKKYGVGGGEKNVFFESCSYDVECRLGDTYIEKTITKTLDIRSYTATTLTNWNLCSSTFHGKDDTNTPTLEFLNIAGQDLPVDENTFSKSVAANSGFDVRSGYNKTVHFYLIPKLFLSPNEPMKVVVTYITRVPINDILYSCRLVYPCKQFKFTFRLTGEGSKGYYVAASAFGFCDDGKNTPNGVKGPIVNVEFNDWIFPRDGVSIALIKKL